jgi:hypothetical protein
MGALVGLGLAVFCNSFLRPQIRLRFFYVSFMSASDFGVETLHYAW